MFITQLISGFIVSSFTIAVILLMKKLFRKHLSAKWHYNLWYLLFIALLIPFIPARFFMFDDLFSFLPFRSSQASGVFAPQAENPSRGNVDWISDFSVSVHHATPAYLDDLIAVIWICGLALFVIPAVIAWMRIKRIQKNMSTVKNEDILRLLEECKQQLHISRDLVVGESPFVKTPMMFGLHKVYVVFPLHFQQWLTMNDIKYILLHELNHYKNKDNMTNYLIVIFQILYWFNPLVWFAFREMRLDREISCDSDVLKALEEQSYREYGNTIIHFVHKVSRQRNLVFESQMVSSKEQLKKRIQKIASFQTESTQLKKNSIAIFILAGVLVASQIPLVAAIASENAYYPFSRENTDYEDLSSYFEGYDGSFVLYDMKADHFQIYNKQNSERRVSPDSTYKIYIGLFAFETGIITKDNSTLAWNGEVYPYASWNKNQNVKSAMESSVSWYFEELDKKMNLKSLQTYLKQLSYGNENLSGGLGQYWIESTLKISPVEQVLLLKSLYTNQLGFHEKNIQAIKETIQLEEKDGAKLSGKTGTGTVNDKTVNGWFIGYVEKEGNTYFFATNIQNEDHSNGSKAAQIALSILKNKGIY
ncbi:BlaR1 family beta-lactam sensor/signal transducer [Brevibacillus reuszeri]|uniref:Beta-lactamase n=1 Tax=Brevibacillus reuszeri TaxID=54915 RepID=A0A0K9YR77_9BACL|nr:BlaR1 family beta-lactam sensor/signal transducer [Brevibacillus reuszeri]KNB70690.1 beta-lactamase [Brevibacillus reuszeri]MED1861306.1 BlaR1 family beta-lactam sensor/signal transducer [Brevibacillus reuszeri]GED69847.1 BlaR1 family beta-lactam sensor/signal transducer [Brevibacillus reuszeri]